MTAPATPPPATDILSAAPLESEAVRQYRRHGPGGGPVPLARLGDLAKALPEVGAEFQGFRLEEELGRGAFGRVYLARQGDLGGRPVALKVGYDIFGESRTLAQLQHTNVVPIYSYHRAGRLQAVCMPYFGRTTLADVLRQIGGRPNLPSSGKELRSTVNRFGHSTLPDAAPSDRPSSLPARSEGASPEAPVAAPAGPAPGAATEGWSRLEGLSYVEVVLSLGAQLAAGLAHAHGCGILHLDLKPANVLLTDEGRPMLLDFNLAVDTKARGTAEGAAVGGTLPYMAPEHLEAFLDPSRVPDRRCDVYALGVILYELLTGRHPFPAWPGVPLSVIPLMLTDRRQPPPPLRRWNPAVPPGAEAVVRKCLAADPADRYQSAEDLREDIERHLGHQPLRHAPNPSLPEVARKWARRHPRLTSSGAVAAAAAVLLAAAGAAAAYAHERTRTLQARALYTDHRAAFRDAQLFLDDRNQSRPHLDEALARLRGVLGRYGVPDDPAGGDRWEAADPVRHLAEAEREQLRGDVGETFYQMAQVTYLRALAADPSERTTHLDKVARYNAAAERYAGGRLPRAVREQRAAAAELRGDPGAAGRLRDEAARAPADSPRDLYLLGAVLNQTGRHRDALPYLRQATQLDPGNFSAWFVRGTAHLALDQPEMAAMCFGACLALRADFAPAWLNRGQAFTRLRFFDQACDDYDRAARLDPGLAEAYVQRATARAALGDLRAAEGDLGRALETGSAAVRVYFLRAGVRDRLGDAAGAAADRAEGLRLAPADELSWIARAEARVAGDPAGALADVEEALAVNPFSAVGLQLKAHILGERLDRPVDALAVLDLAVEFHPDAVPVRAGRGVLLARAGRRDEAVRDAKDALLRDTRAPNLYQVGCIYALGSKANREDRAEALRLLWAALKTGFGLDMVETDPDLDPVRNDPEFKRLVASARAYHAATKR